jgi:hypothetical protein
MAEQRFTSPSESDDIAQPSCLTPALENYLYVHGFSGHCRLGQLLLPPSHPLETPGNTLDAMVQYWLKMDRRRYSNLPFFVRREKVHAVHKRELQAAQMELLPPIPRPDGRIFAHTRQEIEDIRALFDLMDAYDRISSVQNRVRRLLREESTRKLLAE